jgi:yecA family protein
MVTGSGRQEFPSPKDALMSSQSRRYLLPRPGPGDFTPPNVLAIGKIRFGAPERARLTLWLDEAAWPRGHMEMAELEGYLVAMISWPVGIASGAWLPPIWGVRGWKVPTTITSHRDFDEFVGLIAGFMQELDRDLSRESSKFESSVLWTLRAHAQTEAMHCWGRGFMKALSLGAQGLKWRSESSVAAVHAIAASTSSSAALHRQEPAKVVSAVLALMRQRKSRGPLGPLATPAPLDSATVPREGQAAAPPRLRSSRKDET